MSVLEQEQGEGTWTRSVPGVNSSKKVSWRKKCAQGRAALACVAVGWLYVHHQIKYLLSAAGLCGLGRPTDKPGGCSALLWLGP